jgi:hypothetical protein
VETSDKYFILVYAVTLCKRDLDDTVIAIVEVGINGTWRKSLSTEETSNRSDHNGHPETAAVNSEFVVNNFISLHYHGTRGSKLAIDAVVSGLFGVSSPPSLELSLSRVEKTKSEKYSEGMRSRRYIRFIPFAVTEFGALGGHATAFLMKFARQAAASTKGMHVGKLLASWRRKFFVNIVETIRNDNTVVVTLNVIPPLASAKHLPIRGHAHHVMSTRKLLF